MNETDERRRALWNALTMVIDPELGLDIVTLGLVYDAEVSGELARVTYTLTTPGCPMERIIGEGIREAAMLVSGIREVEAHLVWDPAWHAGMING